MKRRIASILMSTVLLLNTMPLSAAPAAGDPAEGAVLHSENVAQEMIQEEELPTGGFTLPEVVEFSEQEAKKINEAFAQKREEEAISAEAAIYSYASETVDEVFVKGASNYGRNHLSAAQKSFYDDLNTALLNFVKSGDTVVQSGGSYIAAEGLAYASYGLDYSGAVEAYMAFDYDHPAYYWLDGPGNDPWSGTIYPTVHEEFADPAIREMRDRQIISGVKRIAAKTAQGNTAFEKIVIVVDEIMEAADYAHEIDPDTGKETNIAVSAKWAHSPIGIFDESLAHVVCEGYADTFALMMNYLDIPNVYIAGFGGGEGHAWNAVSYDGGQTYSYMDITWDDCGHNADTGLAEPSLYMYFGMPKDNFETKHQALSSSYSGSLWLYDLPSSLTNDMQHTYYYMAGHYVGDSTSNLSVYAQNAKNNMIGNGRYFAMITDSLDT
nr:hypothetical protein [Lachnospiraceae bacterium]